MRKNLPSIETFVSGILSGDRVLLARAITLVESALPEHEILSRQIIDTLLQKQNMPAATLRVGISGAPGAGKSTFIEALGTYLTEREEKVAVLAIDPSSALSQGSILGDKTRMEQLSASPLAFIRPSPSGNTLGGVARKTRETILLVEAAGYRNVLIETVGVGQSETAVHSMSDVFLLLLIPGAGDELQGIKRGIVEMADILVVNKADGDRIMPANQARMHYLNATHLLPPKPSQWSPQVLACSALEKTNINKVWETVLEYRDNTLANGFFMENRRKQAAYWLHESLSQGLERLLAEMPELTALEQAVLEGRISPFSAAAQVLGKIRTSLK